MMQVQCRRNKKLAFYESETGFIAKPLDGPEIPQGPFDKCVGCPYPRHGFICWGRDGSCLHTDMEEIYNKERTVQTLNADRQEQSQGMNMEM